MAEVWVAAIGAAGAIGGAYMSAKGAKDAAKTMANAQGQVGTNLTGSNVVGPGGMNANLFQDGQGGTYNLGDMEQARNFLTQFGTTGVKNAGSAGMPGDISAALQRLTGASGVPGAPSFGNTSSQLDSQLLRSVFDMSRGSAAPGLQSTAFTGAAQQLQAANQGFGDVRDNTLATLREQAQPFETRAFDTMQNSQFATGRLGTSGGALQTEAFARGLGQADLSRQLEATNQARLTQQNAFGLAQGMSGMGQSIAGLDDSLLQSAFGRFAQTAGMANDLTQQRFGNSMLLNQTGYDRGLQDLQNRIGLAGLPMALQGQQLQLGLQGLQGAQALNSGGLEQLQAALAMASAGANARIGSGSNVAQIATARANMPSSSDMWGNALTGIASRIGGSPGTMDALGGLFGGGSAPKMPPQPYGGDPRAIGYGVGP